MIHSSFTYAELGRVLSRSINSTATSVVYDALGRVTSVNNALGAFTYGYDGLTRRVASVALPNSLTRAYSYFDQTKDQQLQQILNTKSEGSKFRSSTTTTTTRTRSPPGRSRRTRAPPSNTRSATTPTPFIWTKDPAAIIKKALRRAR